MDNFTVEEQRALEVISKHMPREKFEIAQCSKEKLATVASETLEQVFVPYKEKLDSWTRMYYKPPKKITPEMSDKVPFFFLVAGFGFPPFWFVTIAIAIMSFIDMFIEFAIKSYDQKWSKVRASKVDLHLKLSSGKKAPVEALAGLYKYIQPSRPRG